MNTTIYEPVNLLKLVAIGFNEPLKFKLKPSIDIELGCLYKEQWFHLLHQSIVTILWNVLMDMHVHTKIPVSAI